MCAYGCDSGAKQAMDVSYLPKAMKAGAKAFVNARVEEILTDTASGGAAVGVLAQALDTEGKPIGHRLRLEGRMTLLAAGTFHTPALLKRNRLARGNRHLGRHLTLHPATKVFAEFDEEIRGWEGTPQAYYLDTFHGEGIMFEGIFTPPDIAGMSVPFIGPKMVDFLRSYSRMTSFGFLISDESEGRMVNLPFIGPSFLYSLTQGDTDRIQKGVAFLARTFLKGGAKRVIPLLHGDWELRTEKDLAEFEKARFKSSDVECMAFHPLGTCRMAPDAERGVVSEGNEVFGTPGLYVCDGSVIPSSLGVNPQLTIMALATRLSEKLLGKILT
jgi:choline dehydrogenase-like flavoprotein